MPEGDGAGEGGVILFVIGHELPGVGGVGFDFGADVDFLPVSIDPLDKTFRLKGTNRQMSIFEGFAALRDCRIAGRTRGGSFGNRHLRFTSDFDVVGTISRSEYPTGLMLASRQNLVGIFPSEGACDRVLFVCHGAREGDVTQLVAVGEVGFAQRGGTGGDRLVGGGDVEGQGDVIIVFCCNNNGNRANVAFFCGVDCIDRDRKNAVLNFCSLGVVVVQANRGGPIADGAIALGGIQCGEQGLEVKPVAEAVAEADVVMILLPDQYQAAVYKKDGEPNLKPGAALAFAHGFNIHYGYIKPTEDHPVFMVAPKGPGHIVRREYANGRGVPVVVAVEQDPRGDAWDITLAYAKALGALRAGAIKTTFTEETETDLFGEQDVLMGGINHLCDMGFDVLTEAGYQPEIAYFEVFHELKMLVDLANEGGLNKARWSCSDTAQYGDYTSTVITEETKKRMQYQLKRIQDGSFAKEFMDDQAAGAPKFKKLQEEYSHPHLETVGPKLRAMFSWNNQVDADADMAESFNGKIARTQVQ